MPGWASRPLALLVAATLTGGTTHAAAAQETEARTVLTFADERITESSGLVDRDDVLLTVNDSGDGPVIYVVDKATGRTAGTLTYANRDVTDVEAMAPAGPHAVWVGDIGDNSRGRPFIEVHRVRVPGHVEGDRTVTADTFRLVYPDAPHDAEALLTHPRTGRLYLVTKWVTGGTVYAAPTPLREGTVHRLESVGRVPGLVTGGAFLPDGRHLVLRTYASARVLTFPGLREVAAFPLPLQEQGEALAAVDRDTVLVSTEGEHSDVLAVELPGAAVPRGPAGARSSAPVEPSPSPAPDATVSGRETTTADDPRWVVGGVAVLMLLAAVVLGLVWAGAVVRAVRRRSRRSR